MNYILVLVMTTFFISCADNSRYKFNGKATSEEAQNFLWKKKKHSDHDEYKPKHSKHYHGKYNKYSYKKLKWQMHKLDRLYKSINKRQALLERKCERLAKKIDKYNAKYSGADYSTCSTLGDKIAYTGEQIKETHEKIQELMESKYRLMSKAASYSEEAEKVSYDYVLGSNLAEEEYIAKRKELRQMRKEAKSKLHTVKREVRSINTMLTVDQILECGACDEIDVKNGEIYEWTKILVESNKNIRVLDHLYEKGIDGTLLYLKDTFEYQRIQAADRLPKTEVAIQKGKTKIVKLKEKRAYHKKNYEEDGYCKKYVELPGYCY